MGRTTLFSRRVAVTGASGGIGAALLRAYAAPGTKIFACARNAEALRENARIARLYGAEVICETFDVRDDAKLTDWIDRVTAEGDLDVLLINQGVSASCRTGEKGLMPERTADLLREIDVNARADLLAANEAVRNMIERKKPWHHFQVGLVSSLASFAGLPSVPGYSASKACVRVYGEALRRLVSCHNIGVTVICPGFVLSPMSTRFVGSKPLMVTADVAAERIRRAMDDNRAKCVFPFVLRLGLALLPMLPEWAQNTALAPFSFSVVPDEESCASEQLETEAANEEKRDKRPEAGVVSGQRASSQESLRQSAGIGQTQESGKTVGS